MPFNDTDHVIELRIDYPIREYFKREGEERFREIEESVIDELTQQGKCVLATGGGSILRAENRPADLALRRLAKRNRRRVRGP